MRDKERKRREKSIPQIVGWCVVRVSSSLFVFVRVENRKICKYLFRPSPTHLMRRLFASFILLKFAQCQGKDLEHVIR